MLPTPSSTQVSTGLVDECAHERRARARTPLPAALDAVTAAPPARKGRPPFVATDEQRKRVMILAAAGHTQETMADRIGVNVNTLRKHFRAELDEGTAFANAALGEVLYKKALMGDTKCIENWFDRRGGPEWRKRTASETSGPDGGPIQVAATARRDMSLLTTEEIEALERLTLKLEQGNAASHG